MFEMSSPGRIGVSLPDDDVPAAPLPDAPAARAAADCRNCRELDVMRHFTRLSQLNYSIDSGFYPLGSCTMKYNPTVHEDVAVMPGFAAIHPKQPPETVQGALEVMYGLQEHARRHHRHGRGHLAARRGRARRVHRHPAHPRLPAWRRASGERDTILVPDSRPRHQPGHGHDGGLQDVSLKSDAQRRRGPGAVERQPERQDGRA